MDRSISWITNNRGQNVTDSNWSANSLANYDQDTGIYIIPIKRSQTNSNLLILSCKGTIPINRETNAQTYI